MESDVIQLQDIFEFEIESVAPGPDDHGRTQGHRPSPHLPRQVPQAWHRAPAEHVRRARALARRAKGRNGVKVGPADRDRKRRGRRARSAHPRPRARRGSEAERVADVGVPGQGVHRHAPVQAGADSVEARRHRERTDRGGPRRRSTWRIEERRDSAHRRLEQHEGRSDQECDGRSASLPRRAKEGPPGGDRRVRPRRHRSLGLHHELCTTVGRRRQDAGDVRGHAHLRRADQGREHGEGPGTRANDGRTPVGRHRRRKRRVACRGAAEPPPTTTSASSRSVSSSPQYNAGDAQESREPHRGFVHRVRDASRARADLQGDRAAALDASSRSRTDPCFLPWRTRSWP